MPSKKRFIFKVYSRTGEFIHSTEEWDFGKIVREVNGSMAVDIKTDILTKDIGNSIITPMNQIEIVIADEFTGSEGLVYFSGYIPTRTMPILANDEKIVIGALGHASRLWEMLYRDGTTITMDFTGGSAAKASEIVSDILDKVQALDSDWPVDEATGTVVDSTDDISDKFKSQTAGAAMTRCLFLADTTAIWHWLVKGDNVFHFKKASTTADHKFTYKHDVTELPDFKDDLLEAKNEIFVKYNAGANVKRVADEASITAYGNRSLVVTENEVTTAATATKIGEAILASLLPPLETIKIKVNSTYDQGIESVYPGDTCKVMNLPTDVADTTNDNMFIVRTTYIKDHVILELALRHPRIDSQIEELRGRIDRIDTDDQTATIYA